MLHELLLALLGYTGDLIIDERERQESLRVNLSPDAPLAEESTFKLAPDLSFIQPSDKYIFYAFYYLYSYFSYYFSIFFWSIVHSDCNDSWITGKNADEKKNLTSFVISMSLVDIKLIWARMLEGDYFHFFSLSWFCLLQGSYWENNHARVYLQRVGPFCFQVSKFKLD